MSAEIDASVWALLEATILNIYDGYVTDSDESSRTISAPLPYVVRYSTPGRPINPRLGGVPKGRAVEFQLTAVGMTPEQAKWAGQKGEDAINGARIAIDGRQRMIRRTEDSPYTTRDDTWSRPDGGPLFSDARRYVVAKN